MIKARIDGLVPAKDGVRKVPARVMAEVARVLKVHSVLLKTRVRDRYLTGGTSIDRLAVRTGHLRSSTKEMPLVRTAGLIETGISFGTGYAPVHVGPSGQVTTIHPVNAKYLAIPLAAARTPAGVPRGAPRSGMWGETFFATSRKGNLILFGRRVVQKGARAGQTRGAVVPLFVMKKQVKVRARVDPVQILIWSRGELVKDFLDIGVKIGVPRG